MTHRILYWLALLSLALAFAPTGYAQTTPPAGAGTPSSEASTPGPQSAPTKKVWTNDDVGDLRDHSEISSVGPAATKRGKQGGPSPKGKDAKWYHDQIAKLDAQIPRIEAQIAELRSAIDGTPTGDSKTSTRTYGVKGGDWRTEMADLEAKRDDIEARVSALQDEARHQGIAAEALP
jgi:hypothetical protein